MLPDERELEIEIDRELKALPEWEAPAALLPRLMASIATRTMLPRYRRSWSNWPVGLRWGSLAALLSLFGGLCYAGSGISEAAMTSIRQKFSGNFLGLPSLWSALNELAGSAFVAFQHLGTGALIGIIATLILSYAMFLALGAVYYRLAFSPGKSFRL